ncbi:MAG: GFA family protein [Alphaproteobacteria bacterium]|nr:GFA family protein [Alphaproteobacteria bacterium]
MTRTARCCCGSCAIEVHGEPIVNAICHCRNCRQRTGSAFGWSSYFADDQVLGHTGDYRIYRLRRQERWFCAQCGTTLFWLGPKFAGQVGIAGSCFIDAPLGEPTATASNDGRCAWLSLPPSWQMWD